MTHKFSETPLLERCFLVRARLTTRGTWFLGRYGLCMVLSGAGSSVWQVQNRQDLHRLTVGLGFTLKGMFDRSSKQKNRKWFMFCAPTRACQLGVMACLIGLTACGGGSTPMGPRTPTGLKVTPGNAQVILTWTANRESDIAAYVVSYGLASGALNSTSVVNAPATTATITGLTNGAPYLFAIAARNTAGVTSGRSPGILGTPVAPPPPPAPPPTP